MRRVEHATGEVVIVGHGNFLENPTAVMKLRPGIILVPGDCCHLVVPLTGKETFKGDGTPRRPCPAGPDTGLRSASYFWSRRPCRISRLDVRRHVGWADEEMVDAISDYVLFNPAVVQALREYRHSLDELVA